MLSPFFLCPCMLEITLNAHTHCYQRITNQTLRSLAQTKLSPHTVSNGCWSHVSAHILKGTHLFKHYSLISLTLRRAQFLNTVFDQYISDQYMFWGFFYPLWETIIWVEQYLPMSQTVKLFSIKDSNIQLNTWLLTEDLSHVQTSFWWKKKLSEEFQAFICFNFFFFSLFLLNCAPQCISHVDFCFVVSRQQEDKSRSNKNN